MSEITSRPNELTKEEVVTIIGESNFIERVVTSVLSFFIDDLTRLDLIDGNFVDITEIFLRID